MRINLSTLKAGRGSLSPSFVSRFWEAVQSMKSLPLSKVKKYADEIWSEYLAPDASCPINVDSQSHELSRKNMNTPDRWTFDIAAVKDIIEFLSI